MHYIWTYAAFELGNRGFLISAFRIVDGALLLFHITLDHQIREMRHGSRIKDVNCWLNTDWLHIPAIDRAVIRSICDEYPLSQDEQPLPPVVN
jgi:hypothetical protein